MSLLRGIELRRYVHTSSREPKNRARSAEGEISQFYRSHILSSRPSLTSIVGFVQSTLKPGERERPTDALNRAESADSSEIELGPAASAHSRRKSLSHTAAEVVTVDSIQPDWEAKLAAIRATAARRAARRVVFRQIGERLVPVGISSGREINPNHLITDDQGRLILTTPVPVIGQGREANTSSMIEAGMIGRDGPASSGFASPSRLLGRSSRRRGTTGSSSNPLSEADHRLLLGGE